MSMYRFGDDYGLNYNPLDALDNPMEDGWGKVESVEIDGTVFVNADGNNRWHQLFGTPERAARTLFRIDNSCCEYEVNGKNQSCVTCPLNMNGEAYPKMRCYAHINTGDGLNGEHMDTLLEWLRGDGQMSQISWALAPLIGFS